MITFRNLGRVGRLGNQLYQIAATIGIARDLQERPIFPADWLYRPYFSVPDEMFTDDMPVEAKEAGNYPLYMDPRCRDYLQDYNLFSRHLDEIREYFQPSDEAKKDLWRYVSWPERPCVGVHVRRGDNIIDPGVPNKTDYHRVPGLDYFQRGIRLFPKMDVACFSDDIEWCKANIPAVFYGEGTPYLREHEPGYGQVAPHDWLDLFLLSRCSCFVIGGSTFGIWGAILSGAAPEQVVRPDVVYGPLLDYIDSDLLFDPGWRVLRCF